MTTFDDRGKAFETKFARDADLDFRITVRRNKLVGLWAAEKMGLGAEQADAYAQAVIASDFIEVGDADVIRKVLADLTAAGVEASEGSIEKILLEKAAEARRDVEAA